MLVPQSFGIGPTILVLSGTYSMVLPILRPLDHVDEGFLPLQPILKKLPCFCLKFHVMV
jgi:hypothetical protein